MREVPCFWIEPTEVCQLTLRRYVSSDRAKCPLAHGYHDADAPFGEQPARFKTDQDGRKLLFGYDELAPPPEDPRWPTHCACGYAFEPSDSRQVFFDLVYRHAVTGDRMTLKSAPPGAMWNAWWRSPKEDGIHLMVKLPNGSEWSVDGDARGGGAWTRTGSPPRITANPSILADQGTTHEYHGYLTDGVLRSV